MLKAAMWAELAVRAPEMHTAPHIGVCVAVLCHSTERSVHGCLIPVILELRRLRLKDFCDVRSARATQRDLDSGKGETGKESTATWNHPKDGPKRRAIKRRRGGGEGRAFQRCLRLSSAHLYNACICSSGSSENIISFVAWCCVAWPVFSEVIIGIAAKTGDQIVTKEAGRLPSSKPTIPDEQ